MGEAMMARQTNGTGKDGNTSPTLCFTQQILQPRHRRETAGGRRETAQE